MSKPKELAPRFGGRAEAERYEPSGNSALDVAIDALDWLKNLDCGECTAQWVAINALREIRRLQLLFPREKP